jgi:large subunit ribosomal protein L17
MRHNKSGRQFGRNSSHRRAMLRALTANLIAHERIETTDAKAKELRRVAERVITKARRLGAIAYTPSDKLSLADRARRLAAQQQVGKFLQRFTVVTESADDSEKIDLIEKVFVDLAARYKDRAGGYTRIMKVGNRRGDNAPMSIIELVDRDKKVARAEAGSAAETKAAPKAKAAAKPAKAEAGEAAPKAKKAKAEGDKPEKAAKKKASE